jgi:hypothetical protein
MTPKVMRSASPVKNRASSPPMKVATATNGAHCRSAAMSTAPRL